MDGSAKHRTSSQETTVYILVKETVNEFYSILIIVSFTTMANATDTQISPQRVFFTQLLFVETHERHTSFKCLCCCLSDLLLRFC